MIRGTQDPTIGKRLSRTTHPSLLEQDSLTYLRNGDITDYNLDRTGVFVQNLPGNKLVTGLDEYLGNIRLDNDQYLVFEAPGRISIMDQAGKRTLVDAPCFNFTGKITGRYQYFNGARRVYWIEQGGPTRFLDIDGCLPKVKTSDCEVCGDTFSEDFDCDATLLNPPFSVPCATLTEATGNLPNGVYQIALAFTDETERVTDYYIFPEVLRLHSNISQTFGINVEFSPCFEDFDDYELILITHRADRPTTAQRVGYYNTSQTRVHIDTLDEARYTPIDFEELLSSQVRYEGADHIAVINQAMILAGLKPYTPIDYQSLAMDIQSEWVTFLVPASEAHKYPNFMRGEVYAFDIAWVDEFGNESRRFHIPSDADDSQRLVDAPVDSNHWEPSSACNPEVLKIWEIEDTSTLIADAGVQPVECGPVERAYGKFSYWESRDELYPNDTRFGELACEPIRYHKFPKNNKHGEASHHHTSVECGTPLVQIMGVRFRNIQPPLDCNGDPVNVQGFKIYVANREGQETILSKGLLYNVREETLGSGETSMFQNYPFNDLRPDVFLFKDLKRQGNIFDPDDALTEYYQDRFTYLSPELQFVKGAQGSEFEVYSEEYGSIAGEYHETEDMPRYQELSPLGRLAATVAGALEAREVLHGKPCTTTTIEKVCKKLVDRKTEVKDFPVNQMTGTSGTITLNEIHAAPSGAGSVTGTHSPNLNHNNTIQQRDYEWTTLGDEDCSSTYSLTSLTVLDFSSILGSEFDFFEDSCRLEVETNADPGVTLTIELNGTAYQIGLDDNGNGTIELNADCRPLSPLGPEWNAGNVDHFFTPECECTGDTETISTQRSEVCEPKIKWLDEQDWFKRFPAMMHYFSEGRKAVQDFLESIIAPTNYAIQYTAVSHQSQAAYVPATIRRRIDFQQFLIGQKVFVNDQRFNNWQGSYQDYLELHTSIADPTNSDYSRILMSENNCQPTFACQDFPEGRGQAVNYYGALKRRLVNQYGSLDDYSVRQISCVESGDEITLFGGDTFVTEHTSIRKMPLFSQLPLKLPDNTEFELSSRGNVAFPAFWMDFNSESVVEDIVEDLPVVGNFFYDYNLDAVVKAGECWTSLDFLQYTGVLGGAGYLVQWLAEVATGNFTNPFKLQGRYYTHVTGIVRYYAESKFIGDFREYNELTESHTYRTRQPSELAKAERYGLPELFQYNLQYLHLGTTRQTLSGVNLECCDPTASHRMIFSLNQDQSSSVDRWKRFLPNNFTNLPTQDGKLTVVQEADDNNLFIGFEDAVYLTSQSEGLLTDDLRTVYLGTGDAFSQRLRKLSDDTTGYGGIIDPEALSINRYGIFWYDRKRKRFLCFQSALKDFTNDMQSFFNRHGDKETRMVYDNRSDNLWISLGDVGLLFKPRMQDFVSLLDFSADEYLQLSDNFYARKGDQIWLHNQDNYQNIYGEDRIFEVGLTLKNQMQQLTSASFQVYAEFFKPIFNGNVYDTSMFFEEVALFNQLYSSGIRKTFVNENSVGLNLRQLRTEEVAVGKVHDFSYSINGLGLRSTVQPVYRDQDGVNYELGPANRTEGHPRGRYFELRLRKLLGGHKVLMQLGAGLNEIQQTP